MFNKITTWFKAKVLRTKTPADAAKVCLPEQTADQVIQEILAVIDFEREEHFENIIHLETLIKSILLSAGGSINVSKEFLEMVTKENYAIQVTETEDELKVELIPATEDGDGGKDEDEGDDE